MPRFVLYRFLYICVYRLPIPKWKYDIIPLPPYLYIMTLRAVLTVSPPAILQRYMPLREMSTSEDPEEPIKNDMASSTKTISVTPGRPPVQALLRAEQAHAERSGMDTVKVGLGHKIRLLSVWNIAWRALLFS